MDKMKLAAAREHLSAEKVRLEEEIVNIERGSLRESQNDVSGENAYLDHQADAGSATFDRERDLSLECNVKDILGQVNAALARVDAGTYGRCTRCGQEIDPARLKALPYADMCIECKKKEEQSR